MKYLLMSSKAYDSEVARTGGNSMVGGEDPWTKSTL